MNTNSIFNIENKWLIRVLFAFLFAYLILRGIFVEPLLDELGTLHWYIETGNIINQQAVLDANNHLLNSFSSHYAFRLFGDHLVVYRLLALLSFPIYFFAAKKLVLENIKQFRLLIFVALISIHWVFDYFSLSRGYAPSVAFFVLGLSFISTWNKQNKPFHLAIILGSFTFCLASNLSMFVPIVLLFGYLHLGLIIRWKQCALRSKIANYIISAVFILIAYKLFRYVIKLKEAGALWWGSKNGLWEVTGKSLSDNVFFTSNIYIKYGIIILFSLLIVLFVITLFKKGLKEFVFSIQFLSFGLLLLSLVGTVFLVKVMHLNYPQDRVAMYLVLLLIISMGSLFSEVKIMKWSLLLLLWFPTSFISKVNLNTTIFSPQDRIHNSFHDDIQKLINKQDVLTADYVAHLCYSYSSRRNEVPKMATLNHSESLNGEDYHLSSFYGNIKSWKGYTCILSDDITKMKLYKRISKVDQLTLLDTSIQAINSAGMYLPLLDYPLPNNEAYSKVNVCIEGDFKLTKGMLSFDLIEDIVGSEKQSVNYNSAAFLWYFGLKKAYALNYSRSIDLNDTQNDTLKIYMYNPEMGGAKITSLKIKMRGIKK